MYWRTAKKPGEKLSNDHYEEFYTSFWGIEKDFYQNKSVLDIGCGPRGSLEWANNASERVGLDPLADKYLTLGASEHEMSYVNAYSENIPFEDGHFDVVCALNSVDHVEDLKKTAEEIERVTAKGGTVLIITDIHETPTLNEPQVINWDFASAYFKELEVVKEMHLEKVDETGVYKSLRKKQPFDHDKSESRYGMLCLMLRKQD